MESDINAHSFIVNARKQLERLNKHHNSRFKYLLFLEMFRGFSEAGLDLSLRHLDNEINHLKKKLDPDRDNFEGARLKELEETRVDLAVVMAESSKFMQDFIDWVENSQPEQ